MDVPARPFESDLCSLLNRFGRILIHVIDEEAPVMQAFPVRIDELIAAAAAFLGQTCRS